MMGKIILFLFVPLLLMGQWKTWGGGTTTGTGRPDYIFQLNFISSVGFDTTLWSAIGADIYGKDPSGQFTSYAPFVIPTFFDTTSYLVSVSTTQMVIYAGKANARWDAAIWDIDGRVVPGFDYNDESLALFARMTNQPNTTRKQLISNLIDSLKENGTKNFWSNADRIWVMAAHDSQAARLNWKTDTDNLSPISSPVFAVDQGWTCNGTNSYLNTNFIPSSEGTNWALNTACVMVYIRTNVSESKVDFGGRGAGGESIWSCMIQSRNASNLSYLRINDGTDTPSAANTDSRGMFGISRTASNNRFKFKNYTDYGNEAIVATGRPPVKMFIGALNDNGVASSVATRQYSFCWAGATLSTTEADVLVRIIEWYMDDLGNGVIP